MGCRRWSRICHSLGVRGRPLLKRQLDLDCAFAHMRLVSPLIPYTNTISRDWTSIYIERNLPSPFVHREEKSTSLRQPKIPAWKYLKSRVANAQMIVLGRTRKSRETMIYMKVRVPNRRSLSWAEYICIATDRRMTESAEHYLLSREIPIRSYASNKWHPYNVSHAFPLDSVLFWFGAKRLPRREKLSEGQWVQNP